MGLVEKPDSNAAPSNLFSIRRYFPTPEIFETLWDFSVGSGGEIEFADVIYIHAQKGSVDMVPLNGQQFDCGAVDGFIWAANHEHDKRLEN